jgi:hypothetical protein
MARKRRLVPPFSFFLFAPEAVLQLEADRTIEAVLDRRHVGDVEPPVRALDGRRGMSAGNPLPLRWFG